MQARFTTFALAVALSAAVAGCSNNNGAPTERRRAAKAAARPAAADGTTLKAHGAQLARTHEAASSLDTLQSALRFAAGRVQFNDALAATVSNSIRRTTLMLEHRPWRRHEQDFTMPDNVEMRYTTVYRWRVRSLQDRARSAPGRRRSDFVNAECAVHQRWRQQRRRQRPDRGHPQHRLRRRRTASSCASTTICAMTWSSNSTRTSASRSSGPRSPSSTSGTRRSTRPAAIRAGA